LRCRSPLSRHHLGAGGLPLCQSTLLRDADSVRDIGKMATLLDDYSPLQIASCGIWKGRQFTVVGRIQLAYDAGMERMASAV
jgi:hypothetical protein